MLKGTRMRWRYWLGLLALSVLLHMTVFWPLPTAEVRAPSPQMLSVRILPLQPSIKPQNIEQAMPAAGITNLERGAADAIQRTPSASDGPPFPSVSGRRGEGLARSSSSGIHKQLDEGQASGYRFVPDAKPAASEPSAATGTSDGEAEQGLSLARYRMALAAAAVRMHLPDDETAGMMGTTVVDVRLDNGGPRAHLVASSGVETLDRKALAVISRAIQAVPTPLVGGGSDAFVRLPIVFSSEDL